MTVESLITQHIDTWTSAVKTKSTTGRGSSKKLELYGVKKLRELILELAVRGKLVPQDPNDEPASVLLERIAAEKVQLVKDKKIRKPKILPAITEQERPFVLPKGWVFSKVGEISNLISGKGFKKSEYTNDGVRLFQIANVSLGYTKWEVENYMPMAYLKDYPELGLKNGDVLIALNRPLLNQRMKVCIISDKDLPSILYQRVGKFNFYSSYISTNYFYYYLQSKSFITQLSTSLQGSDQPFINQSQLIEFILPLPPIEEQHRIVAKVDELMALCDQLEQQTEASIEAHQLLVSTLLNTLTNSVDADELMENWARISDHFDTLFTTEESIDQLKQTILQLAVMGKLVPQDPNDEPASVLLERIAEEKAQLIKEKKIKKQKALSPIADDEKPFDLPNGWEWCRLGDLAEFQKGYAFKSQNYLSEGLMITKIQNLTENSTKNSVYISAETLDEYEQFCLLKGDIVMTTVGSWFSAPLSAVGRTFVINDLFDQSLLNQNAVRIRAWAELIPMFTYSYLNAKFFKDYLVSEAQGTANQASITQLSIKNFLMCIPPKNEQIRITSKITELVTICDQLKARLKESQTTQLHLTDSIVEQAV